MQGTRDIPPPIRETPTHETSYYYRPVVINFELGTEIVKSMTLREYPLNTIARVLHYNGSFLVFATQQVLFHRRVPNRHTSLLFYDYRTNVFLTLEDNRIINLNDTNWCDHCSPYERKPLMITIRITVQPLNPAQEAELGRKQEKMYATLASQNVSLEQAWDIYASDPLNDPPLIVDLNGKEFKAKNCNMSTPMIAHPQLFYYPLQGLNSLLRISQGITSPTPLSLQGIVNNPVMINVQNLPNLELDTNLKLFLPKMNQLNGLSIRNQHHMNYIYELGNPRPQPPMVQIPLPHPPIIERMTGCTARNLHHQLREGLRQQQEQEANPDANMVKDATSMPMVPSLHPSDAGSTRPITPMVPQGPPPSAQPIISHFGPLPIGNPAYAPPGFFYSGPGGPAATSLAASHAFAAHHPTNWPPQHHQYPGNALIAPPTEQHGIPITTNPGATTTARQHDNDEPLDLVTSGPINTVSSSNDNDGMQQQQPRPATSDYNDESTAIGNESSTSSRTGPSTTECDNTRPTSTAATESITTDGTNCRPHRELRPEDGRDSPLNERAASAAAAAAEGDNDERNSENEVDVVNENRCRLTVIAEIDECMEFQ